MIITIAAALLAGQADTSVTERTEPVEMRLYREDGENRWAAGEWGGRWAGRGTAMNIMNVRRRNRASMELEFTGPGFEEEPVMLQCSGGESETEFLWITWERSELAYTCVAQSGDTRLDLALQDSGGLFGRARNERAGETRHEGETVRFETQRLSGVGFPSGRVPGYVIRTVDGEEIGGMDYRMMRPLLYLPHEGEPHREIALITAVALATFMDPANMN